MKPVLRLVVLYLQDSKREDEGEPQGRLGESPPPPLKNPIVLKVVFQHVGFSHSAKTKFVQPTRRAQVLDLENELPASVSCANMNPGVFSKGRVMRSFKKKNIYIYIDLYPEINPYKILLKSYLLQKKVTKKNVKNYTTS